MSDVDLLLAQCPWLAKDTADAGSPEPHQPVELTGMPVMSRLLSTATVTPLRLDGIDHELLAWGAGHRARRMVVPSPGGS